MLSCLHPEIEEINHPESILSQQCLVNAMFWDFWDFDQELQHSMPYHIPSECPSDCQYVPPRFDYPVLLQTDPCLWILYLPSILCTSASVYNKTVGNQLLSSTSIYVFLNPHLVIVSLSTSIKTPRYTSHTNFSSRNNLWHNLKQEIQQSRPPESFFQWLLFEVAPSLQYGLWFVYVLYFF